MVVNIIDNYSNFIDIFRYFFLKSLPCCFYKNIIEIEYKKYLLKKLNLDYPQTLSEKIQWIKLYGINEKKAYLSDKLKAKEYIQNNIKELNFARVYQQGNSFNEINFDVLPDKFVLKTNNSWHTNVIINEKSLLTKHDIKKLEKFYKKVLNINYAYWGCYELQYKDIRPQIYAEELINPLCNNYEIWCLNGVPQFITYRFIKRHELGFKYSKQYCLNLNLEQLDFNIHFKNIEKETIKLSSKVNKMVQYAKILSKDFDFVRIDFIEYNNEIYFCEFTFTPYSGFIPFFPSNYDLEYGKKLKISNAF